MFYGGMAGAAVTLVIAILVYVKLNVAQVIADLTGWDFPGSTRKGLKKSRVSKDSSTKPITKEINVRKNVEKEVAAGEYVDPTEKMMSGSVDPTALLNSGGTQPAALKHGEGLEPTVLLSEESFESTALLAGSRLQSIASGGNSTTLLAEAPTETTILSDWEETTVLTADPDETTLLGDMDETTLLDDMDETTLLTEEEPRFQKQVDIMIVHSNITI